MAQVIGIVGGSGLYALDGLEDVREIRVSTPYGEPSDVLVRGRMAGVDLVFLPRHGRGHRLLPSEVPYRANVWALASLGVDWLVSVSAVGSLREEIVPGDVVVVDQYIDKTSGRAPTFFGGGVVAHAGFGDPTCARLRAVLVEAARKEPGLRVHDGGVYVCMEGPAFSTRAESELHRSWGASVIGMTAMPEAKLAREASMSYATLAFATDYDCWRPDHDAVTVEQVIAVLLANVDKARRIVATTAAALAAEGPAPLRTAMRTALMTPLDTISAEARTRLGPVLERALG